MRDRLINAGLILLSLLVGYLVLDFGVFHRVVDKVPLALNQQLGKIKVLGQSSKAGPIPRDYIAVLGDSNAAGAGDWVIEVGERGNPDFQATHVLHRLSGRDVISLGTPGVGEVVAYVVEPVKTFEGINIGSAFHLDPPRRIFAYFYEANHLARNLLEIRELMERTGGRPSEAEIAAYVREVAARERARVRRGWYPWKNAFLMDFALNLLRYDWHRLTGQEGPRPLFPLRSLGAVNAERVGDEYRWLPDGLQGPNLQLKPEETTLGVAVFRASLAFLRDEFPGVPITVVYIPSVLSVYELASAKVQVRFEGRRFVGRPTLYDAKAVAARSDEICRLIEAGAKGERTGFLDTRGAFRAASAAEFLHGPRDWDHLNRRGYTVLAETLAKALAKPDADATCIELAAK